MTGRRRPGCRTSWRAAPGALCTALFLAGATAPSTAHEGHDLVTVEAGGAARSQPRLVVDSESYELVAVLEGQRLTIYLDRFGDNSPVTDAKVAVTVNEETVAAETEADGTYSLISPQFVRGGLFELVFD